MNSRVRFPIVTLGLLLLLLLGVGLVSAENFDEATDGPLSSNGLNPTALTGTLGSNHIDGSVGRHPDVRYFSIVVPSDMQLSAINLTEHVAGDQVSWFAAMTGGQFTENATSGSLISTSNLLGYAHVGTAGGVLLPDNVMPNMGLPNTPLPTGTYSFRMQNWGSGIDFAFELVLTETDPTAVTLSQANSQPANSALILTITLLLMFSTTSSLINTFAKSVFSRNINLSFPRTRESTTVVKNGYPPSRV